MPVPREKMDIGSIMVVTDTGSVLEVIDVQDDGSRVFKQLPSETKYDRDAAFYCFSSMLKPFKEVG